MADHAPHADARLAAIERRIINCKRKIKDETEQLNRLKREAERRRAELQEAPR